MEKKTIYYKNPLQDDFAGTKITYKPLPPNYRYLARGPISFLLSGFLYYVIAKPLLYLVGKIGYGVKVKGRKNVKKLRHKGYFFYSNHTQILDGWAMQCFVAGLKRTYIVANQDATSIPFVRGIVKLMGCLPVPYNIAESKKFQAAVAKIMDRHQAISIYPEAHIWPYCTHIRPFKDDAFVYPAALNAPIIVTCTTYRPRRVFKKRPPKVTIHVSKPIYPDMTLSLEGRKKQLRDRAYEFMVETASNDINVEYIRYIREKAGE